jgi:hypothetical protein
MSIIYSAAHPDKEYGVNLGDNTYDQFRAGYFQGLGMTHFVPREEIDELFAKRFQICSLTHTFEADVLDSKKILNAFWKIECAKAA